MTDDRVMTSARFAALAQAYGGRLDRWPEAWRNEGRTFSSSPEGRSLLADEDALDAVLDLYTSAPPGAALIGAIVETGARHLARRRRPLHWSLGLGLAGIGVAGGVFGAMMMTALLPDPEPRWAWVAETVTAFGDIRTDAYPAPAAP